MPFDFANFVNAGQFSDAGTLAGFNPNEQMVGLRDKVASSMGMPSQQGGGVAPPDQSFTDVMGNFAKQAVAPYQQKYEQFSGAAGQAAQGNFGNAANMMLGKKIQQPTETTTPTINYDHQWH